MELIFFGDLAKFLASVYTGQWSAIDAELKNNRNRRQLFCRSGTVRAMAMTNQLIHGTGEIRLTLICDYAEPINLPLEYANYRPLASGFQPKIYAENLAQLNPSQNSPELLAVHFALAYKLPRYVVHEFPPQSAIAKAVMSDLIALLHNAKEL